MFPNWKLHNHNNYPESTLAKAGSVGHPYLALREGLARKAHKADANNGVGSPSTCANRFMPVVDEPSLDNRRYLLRRASARGSLLIFNSNGHIVEFTSGVELREYGPVVRLEKHKVDIPRLLVSYEFRAGLGSNGR
ncbi:uncharacterized protein VTP21DRAFT_11453 [Calcarisporiella thermophila]|uniref:uncharacterized protein n=1 Tax=Calcarisporiella thermophila TaxID=911321 RepID=UPI0037429D69